MLGKAPNQHQIDLFKPTLKQIIDPKGKRFVSIISEKTETKPPLKLTRPSRYIGTRC